METTVDVAFEIVDLDEDVVDEDDADADTVDVVEDEGRDTGEHFSLFKPGGADEAPICC